MIQSILLKFYFFNISSSLHWFILENRLHYSDAFNKAYESFNVNYDLLAEIEKKDKENDVLKGKLLVSDSNNFTADQITLLNTNKSTNKNWMLGKTRFCSNDSLYLYLEKNPGLKKGALVIHNVGVIGLIANDCNDSFCLVNFLNHKDTSLALNNKNDQISGLMSVTKNNNLTLNYVNKKGNLIQNEVLYTAGFTPEQPAGFPVAKVSEKFLDFKNQFHYYLTPVESLNCPSWAYVWNS